MTIQLPAPLSAYFKADAVDGEAVAQCFAEAAIVTDEGGTHAGRDAIRQWKAGASAKYTYTSEPFAITTEGGRIVVTSHVTGDFPGSPVDLRYLFVLDGGKIASLEIVA
ncbi:nuclear transport factor 2 family protein [Labrys monachus]|uniref:SnoaL-like domain-containing protein n=1 Tax=Labrys monachus TaxID=217067 RepID=A0ABU0FGC6_9HYPH|nr:nuclear transport factor 2 family protein [Labrys monachus]MDQ0393664.1 hypothetical protein [Labrys monachus]